MTELKFGDYGQSRELDATPGELKVFETIRNILSDDGADVSHLFLIRKSSNYVSAVLSFGDKGPYDLARIKYTDRAKWIWTSYNGKVKLRTLEDVTDLSEAFLNDYWQTIDWLKESYPEVL